MLIIYTLLYLTSLVFIPIITDTSYNLYLLTTFLQFPLPPPHAFSNHKSDLFFCEFVCLFAFEV